MWLIFFLIIFNSLEGIEKVMGINVCKRLEIEVMGFWLFL